MSNIMISTLSHADNYTKSMNSLSKLITDIENSTHISKLSKSALYDITNQLMLIIQSFGTQIEEKKDNLFIYSRGKKVIRDLVDSVSKSESFNYSFE